MFINKVIYSNLGLPLMFNSNKVLSIIDDVSSAEYPIEFSPSGSFTMDMLLNLHHGVFIVITGIIIFVL